MKVFTIGALAIAGVLYAQHSVPQPPQERSSEQQTRVPYRNAQATSESEAFAAAAADPSKVWIAMLGKIQSFKAGEEISIKLNNGEEKTFSLPDATLMEDVAVGDHVLVMASKHKGGPVKIFRDTGSKAEQNR